MKYLNFILASFLLVCCDNTKSRVKSFVESDTKAKLNQSGEFKALRESLGAPLSVRADIHTAKDGWYKGNVIVNYRTPDSVVTQGQLPESSIEDHHSKLLKLKQMLETTSHVSLTDPDFFSLFRLYDERPGVIEVLPKGTAITMSFYIDGTFGKETCSVNSMKDAKFSPEIDQNPNMASRYPGQKVFKTQKEYNRAFDTVLGQTYAKAETALRQELQGILNARAPYKPGTKYTLPYNLDDRKITAVLEILDYDTDKEQFSAVLYDQSAPDFRKLYNGTLSRDRKTKKLDGEPTELRGEKAGPVTSELHAPVLFEATTNRIFLVRRQPGKLYGESHNLMKGDDTFVFSRIDSEPTPNATNDARKP